MCLFALIPQPSCPWNYNINTWFCLLLGSEFWKFQGKLANQFWAKTSLSASFTHSEYMWVLTTGEPSRCLDFPVASWLLLENESSAHVLHTCLEASMGGGGIKEKNTCWWHTTGEWTSGTKNKSHIQVVKPGVDDAVSLSSWISGTAQPGRAPYSAAVKPNRPQLLVCSCYYRYRGNFEQIKSGRPIALRKK